MTLTLTTPKPAVRPLLSHQLQAVDFLVNNPFAGIWINIGGGKTTTVLAALQLIRPMGHILVIAPVAIARATWINEIEELGLPIRTKSLIVNGNDKKLTTAKRLEAFQQVFNDPPTMYFINQDLISRPPMRSCETCGGTGKKIGACTACQTGLVDQMPIHRVKGPDGKTRPTITWPFPTVIIDESQEFKSSRSNRFKALKSVRPAITRLMELTGSPAPNGLEDLWSQMYLLDQGEALGATITEFRERWFTPEPVYGTQAAKWIPNPEAEKEIHAKISHLVMSAVNTSIKLTDPIVEDVDVRLPGDLLDAYKSFKRSLVVQVVNEAAQARADDLFTAWLAAAATPAAVDAAHQLSLLPQPQRDLLYADLRQDFAESLPGPDHQFIHTVVAANQAVLTSKLMQFASGTLYTSDPEDPSTAGRYEVIHNEKIQSTAHIIGHTNSPVLVAYHFASNQKELQSGLTAAGIQVETFDGSRDMIRRWNAQQIPVMLIHPASAGAGLNLQHGGSTLIWYTLPFSLGHYQQTIGRIQRMGQTKQVRIYRLLTRGTQDDRMPTVLNTKALTQDRLMRSVDIEKKLLAALEEEIAEDLADLWSTIRL